MRKHELSSDLQKQLAALVAMPDDQIDTKDIPEAPAEAWKQARQPDFYKPVKKPVTLRLDMDVLAWYQAQTDRGYQTEMNRVLRKHMLETEAHSHV